MIYKKITSEYVSFGHPDKIADQIADALTDAIIRQDKNARTGIEVMVKDNHVILGGEINTTADVDYEAVVRKVFENLNFPQNHGLQPWNIEITNLIGKQSPEIHGGVDNGDTIGAGDQGFMVGFASDEAPNYMPLGHYLAKQICLNVAMTEDMGPDTKCQVVITYDENNNPVKIDNILVSTMHQCAVEDVREIITNAILNNEYYLDEDIYKSLIQDKNVNIVVNPCGEWQIGGPVSDCGITGRKIVVDAYGGYCNVGGGNYSGKDGSKVDRSGAYMARYIAKNIVASGFANTAKVTLSYMISVPEPCAIDIEVNKNQKYVDELKTLILKNVNVTPKGIIEKFSLDSDPEFYLASRFGHYGFAFGRWEDTDLSELLIKNKFWK